MLHSSRCNDYTLLKFTSILFRVIKSLNSVSNVLFVLLAYLNFAVQSDNSGLQSFDFNFLIRNLHGHLMLLVPDDLLVIEGRWSDVHGVSLLGRALFWTECG